MKQQAKHAKNKISRRGFIRISAAAAAGFLPVMAGAAAFAQAGAAGALAGAAADGSGILPADFQNVSQFLTGKTISPLLAQRVWIALNGHDRNFAAQYSALAQFLRASAAASIDVLKNNKAFQGRLKATAQAIISAYYLGCVGTPKALSAHDDVVFITYTQALMYQITYAHTPIPTYSRRDSGFWTSPADPR